MTMDDVPILVGVGEVCEPVPDNLFEARSAVDLSAEAANRALTDTGRADQLRGAIDAMVAVRTFSDSSPLYKNPIENVDNMPRAVAAKAGIFPDYACYSTSGGQSPQMLVNEFCRRLARQEFTAVLLTGGEAIATVKAARRSGAALDWSDDTGGQIDDRGWGVDGILTDQEILNEFYAAGAVYGLLENARRGRIGESREAYARRMGKLLAPFSAVAANHPAAMFPREFDAQTIAAATEGNPYIFQPYTLAMMAKDGVNQAAALILTTVGRARALGVDASRWMYLGGYCDLKERTVLERPRLDESPAMRLAYRTALDRAEVSVDDVDVFDLYSCFPIAVFTACDALGLSPDDPRGLTVTGGLPFFGGAGNNYSMHGIVSVARRLRQMPHGIGVVGANGGFMSKHSVGVYTRKMPARGWRFFDESALQQQLDRVPAPPLDAAPAGEAVVESYSVTFSRGAPVRAHAVGRLCDTDARFLAVTDPEDRESAQTVADRDFLGRRVFVASRDGRNRFAVSAERRRGGS